MYTILMKDNKELEITEMTKLYQREKLVDKIRFLLPLAYGDLDISKMTVNLKYTDQGNVPHSEVLRLSDERFENTKLVYYLPVDSDLTRFAGDILIHLTLTNVDIETSQQHIMHTGEVTITISPIKDIYAFASDSYMESVDQKMLELDARIAAADKLLGNMSENAVDDIMLTNDLLQVSTRGKALGQGVKILIPTMDDGEYDGTSDGLLDLDSIDIPTTPDNPTDDDSDDEGFIEL